jgi:transmembrane sensor
MRNTVYECLYNMNKSSLNRFFLNESSDSERKDVIEWLLNPSNDLLIRNWMQENWDFVTSIDYKNYSEEPDVKKIWFNIQEKINQQSALPEPAIINNPATIAHVSFKLRFKQIASVAAAIFIFSCGLYFWNVNHSGKGVVTAENKPAIFKNDIPPPENSRPVLTLANGTIINLDSSGKGTLAIQGGISITRKADGEIIYSGKAADIISYNTLSLPKGNKPMRLILSDGSVAWLNAASSITYPTAFAGNERKVTITGEAYFEVAKNAAMPFFVSHNDVVVKVLGTHFNVNSYDDEQTVKVTLLEGAVHVSKGEKIKVLKPGQQAELSKENISLNNNVNIDEVMAWKNEQFYFNGADIKAMMRQIEKYYNVDIEYRDDINYKFIAKISRQVNVSEFLRKLELTGLIHFKIEANKIIITK